MFERAEDAGVSDFGEQMIKAMNEVGMLVDVSHCGDRTRGSRPRADYGFRDKIDIEGFDHPRKTFDLAEALIRRGYSDDNIGAILGGNSRRLSLPFGPEAGAQGRSCLNRTCCFSVTLIEPTCAKTAFGLRLTISAALRDLAVALSSFFGDAAHVRIGCELARRRAAEQGGCTLIFGERLRGQRTYI